MIPKIQTSIYLIEGEITINLNSFLCLSKDSDFFISV